MDRDQIWAVKRDVLIHTLERYLDARGSGDRKRNFAMGLRNYLKRDKQTEDEFYEALGKGAQLVHIPLNVGQTGRYKLICCKSGLFPEDEIELTIFSYQVWKCPRCGKVYALHNEAGG